MTVGGPLAPSSEDPLLNRVLSERYRILKKLGEGGMGVVYLAEHVVIEKKIALKILFPDLTRRSDLVQRFMQEAKSASRIGHENVIDITDFGQSPEGYVFIAMEYLVGQDLGQLLKASGPMPWPRVQPIVLQIVKALRAAHERGIVHRDMKPENVFVLPRDEGREFVKVLDFGIAKVLGLDEDAPRLTRTGMIFGTPEYMSPEQAQGQQIDHRVDIYAVGCILYHMLTGDVPFRAESFMGILSKHMLEMPIAPSVRNPAIEPRVEALINRAMEKDPSKRFQTMGEFVEALVPLGYIPDMSGAIAMSAARPLPPAAVPTRAGSPVPDARIVEQTSAAVPLVTTGPLPHSTKEIEGRASTPLAEPNPEVRRSRTAIFSHDEADAPPARRHSGNVAVIGAGVGAVVLFAILFLMFRGRGGSGGDSVPAGGGKNEIAGTRSSPNAAAAVAAPVPGAAARLPTVPASTTPAGHTVGTSSDPSANPAAAASTAGSSAKKAKDAPRSRRSSREAIDSLFPTPPPDTADSKADRKGGATTPVDLKNPFATPSP
jgi:serine/threonine protein kinase